MITALYITKFRRPSGIEPILIKPRHGFPGDGGHTNLHLEVSLNVHDWNPGMTVGAHVDLCVGMDMHVNVWDSEVDAMYFLDCPPLYLLR